MRLKSWKSAAVLCNLKIKGMKEKRKMAEYKLKPGKIGNAVIDTYKKIENGVVGAYKKIEDSFVNTFLEKTDKTEEQ